ncbi:HD domain-containing protein [Hyalangium versicolor]|uniref:HD domain-containing protein n=1 Tax=Hyalangium versicolor TaxID=2861190 RepID=UPI001CCA73B2|nr:HD domain-containing protein [Hyalangium versicolor]
MLSVMNLRGWLIVELGPRDGNVVLDPETIVAWFWSLATMPIEEAASIVNPAFHQAAAAPTDPPVHLRPLPDEVIQLLFEVGAPPRLAAHLRAVHDVARQLIEGFVTTWPQLSFDADAVSYGAATHDIGKALYPNELTSPGDQHESAGYSLLLQKGVPERRARFARTHAEWDEEGATTEDQLVALADKIWKGRREEDLEQLLVQRIVTATGYEPWKAFIHLDELLNRIAAQAEGRLQFQARFAVSTR